MSCPCNYSATTTFPCVDCGWRYRDSGPMAYADSGRFFKLRINGLLDEEAFAKLIASDEHFGRAIAGEQVGNFPVLKNPLRLEGTGCGNQFQILAVHDTVTMEEDRLPCVKHGENNSAVAHERCNP